MFSLFQYHLQAKRHRVNMNTLGMSKRYDCSLCDRTYSRKFDMKRHEQYAHPKMEEDEETNEDSNDDDEAREDEYQSESSSKSQRDTDSNDDEDAETSDSESEGDDDSSNSETACKEEPEDNQAYQEWFEKAMTATEELRNEKYQKYISQGMDEEDAKEKAHVKVLWAVRRTFFNLYSKFLQDNLSIGEDVTHQEIMSDLEEKVENGKNVRKAVQRVLAKHGVKFEGLFQYQDEDEDDSEEDMDGTEESDNDVE